MVLVYLEKLLDPLDGFEGIRKDSLIFISFNESIEVLNYVVGLSVSLRGEEALAKKKIEFRVSLELFEPASIDQFLRFQKIFHAFLGVSIIEVNFSKKEVVFPEGLSLPIENFSLHVQWLVGMLQSSLVILDVVRIIGSLQAIKLGEQGMNGSQPSAGMLKDKGADLLYVFGLIGFEEPFYFGQLAFVEEPAGLQAKF